MVRYNIKDLHAILLWMTHMINYTLSQERHRHGEASLLTQSEKTSLMDRLLCVEKHCKELELEDAVLVCKDLFKRLDQATMGEIRGHLLGIRSMMDGALARRVFLYIPSSCTKYVPELMHPTAVVPGSAKLKKVAMPFGEAVHKTFADARYDAEQAALCIAVGASTAAIFHLMRVVEHGVRMLGRSLDFRKMRQQKAGKDRLVPIENLPWEILHNQLRVRVNDRLAKLRPGPAKDKKSYFYNSILEDFQGFKDAWRNHVMHARSAYGEKESLRVLGHVERFMQLLATKGQAGMLP